ncbi:MAG: hypothetical protein ACKV0T_17850 [Planctomycetales bacterium]
MRRFDLALVFGIGLGIAGCSSAAGDHASEPAAKLDTATEAAPGGADDSSGAGLIVHEWGTFTSFSGSDGVRLEFRPLVDEDLPPFVLDRFLQSGVDFPFTKSTLRVRMRMETPITYFYTDRERDVSVRVEFPDGLLTEFYPPVARMQPAYSLFEPRTLKQSSLDWGRIHLIPTDRLEARVEDPGRRRLLQSLLAVSLTPPADPKFHYGHARQTDAALIHVHRPHVSSADQPHAPAGDFFEKFLFYRGVGNFDLPLQFSASGDGEFELANTGDDPIRQLFLIDVEGSEVRWSRHEQIAAGSRLPMCQAAIVGTIDALADEVAQALVAEGLYEKEAVAMVNTWRSSWFGEAGTRLLYVVPRALTDALLPLHVDPQPQESVRVLVGRMEVMTPEQEAQVVAMVEKSVADRQADQEAAQAKKQVPTYTGPAELGHLGRLAEPALTRVAVISENPAVRAEARLLIRQLRW